MIVLGIHVFGHDCGAALISPRGCTAVTEERLSRVKNDTSFPANAIRCCLEFHGVQLPDVDLVVHNANFGRFPKELLEWLFLKHFGWYDESRFVGVDHHALHAWGALAFADLPDCAVLVVDGNGSLVQEYRSMPKAANCHPAHYAISETVKASMFRFSGGELTRIKYFTRSPGIGALYATVTQYLGFGKLEAGKTMGLAAFSRGPSAHPPHRAFTREASTAGDLEFSYHQEMIDPDILSVLLRREPRPADVVLPDPFYNEVAGLIQRECESWVLQAVEHLATITAAETLVLSGGVALNCKANQVIERSGCFRRYSFFPAASDTGIPLGGAVYGCRQLGGDPKEFIAPESVYLGRGYSEGEITSACREFADRLAIEFPASVPQAVAGELAGGRFVGLFQGRSELGPRALGNRSILADPRSPEGKDALNARVKRREAWRPFGPVLPLERYGDFFPGDSATKGFMNVSDNVHPHARSEIPAAVHVDGTARPQAVSREGNRLLHAILLEFGRLTGVPVLINTSFNVAGEPIVESPSDALRCLLDTGLDVVAFPHCLVRKT